MTTRLHELAAALAEPMSVTDVRVVRDRELHCSVRPAAVPALAGLLRARFGAELVFMAAADRRADGAAFEVHYLFTPTRENWFL